jgi:hypothetical protein
VTTRATSHIKQPEIKMDRRSTLIGSQIRQIRRATKRATQHANLRSLKLTTNPKIITARVGLRTRERVRGVNEATRVAAGPGRRAQGVRAGAGAAPGTGDRAEGPGRRAGGRGGRAGGRGGRTGAGPLRGKGRGGPPRRHAGGQDGGRAALGRGGAGRRAAGEQGRAAA